MASRKKAAAKKAPAKTEAKAESAPDPAEAATPAAKSRPSFAPRARKGEQISLAEANRQAREIEKAARDQQDSAAIAVLDHAIKTARSQKNLRPARKA